MDIDSAHILPLTDLNALGQLSRGVYKMTRDCAGLYQELATTAQQLTNIVEDLGDLVRSYQLEERAKSELNERAETCNETLVDLNTMLTKYKYMDTTSRETVDSQGWSGHDAKDIRTRLNSAVMLLSAFYNGLQTSAFIRVQKTLEQYSDEIRCGARDGQSLTTIKAPEARDGSEQSADVRRDFEQLGLTQAMVEEYWPFITAKLMALRDHPRYDSGKVNINRSGIHAYPHTPNIEDSTTIIHPAASRTFPPENEGQLRQDFERLSFTQASQIVLTSDFKDREAVNYSTAINAPQPVQPGMIVAQPDMIPVEPDFSQKMRSMSLNAGQPIPLSPTHGLRSHSVSAPQTAAPIIPRRGILLTAYESAVQSTKGDYLNNFSEAAFVWNQRRYATSLKILTLAYVSVSDPSRSFEMDAVARHCSAAHLSYTGEFTNAKYHFIANINHLGGPRSNYPRCHELRLVGLRWLGDTCLQLGDAPNALFAWALAIEGYAFLSQENVKPWNGVTKSLLFEFPRIMDYEKERFRMQDHNNYVFPEFSLAERERALVSALQTVDYIKNACSGKRKYKSSNANFNDFTRPPTSRTPMLFRSGPPYISHSSEWFGKVLSCDPFLDMENTLSLALHKQPRPGSGLQYAPWSSGEISLYDCTRTIDSILDYFRQEFSRDMAAGHHIIGLRMVPEWSRLCCFATLGHDNIVAMVRLTVRVYKPMQKKSDRGRRYCVQYSYNTTDPSRPMAQPRSPHHESTDLEPWFKGKVEAIASTIR